MSMPREIWDPLSSSQKQQTALQPCFNTKTSRDFNLHSLRFSLAYGETTTVSYRSYCFQIFLRVGFLRET